MNLYQWVAWLHVLFAFLFFFVHGISMATAFYLRREKDVKRLGMLLDLPEITIIPMAISLLALLLTSIYMGASAGWWKTGWWGLSVLLFLVMVAWMTWYGRTYYSPIRKELGLHYMTGVGTPNAPDENKAINMDAVNQLIAKTNPHLLATVGLIVLGLLLWLMRFKPF